MQKNASAALAAGDKYRYGSEIELELDFSGESDKEPDSHVTPPTSGSPGVDINRARIAGSGLRDEELIEVFGPSDSSDEARSEGGNAPMRSLARSNSKNELLLVSARVLALCNGNLTAMSCGMLRR